jgi:hypothetical protein
MTFILTVPHSACPPQPEERRVEYTTSQFVKHPCDTKAHEAAEVLKVAIDSTGIPSSTQLFANLDVPRSPDLDMNRQSGRDSDWRRMIEDKIREIGPDNIRALIDVHSFPLAMHDEDPWEGKDFVIMPLVHPHRWHEFLLEHVSKRVPDIRCAIINGAIINDIMFIAQRKYDIPSTILEFSEDLSHTSLVSLCAAISHVFTRINWKTI